MLAYSCSHSFSFVRLLLISSLGVSSLQYSVATSYFLLGDSTSERVFVALKSLLGCAIKDPRSKVNIESVGTENYQYSHNTGLFCTTNKNRIGYVMHWGVSSTSADYPKSWMFHRRVNDSDNSPENIKFAVREFQQRSINDERVIFILLSNLWDCARKIEIHRDESVPDWTATYQRNYTSLVLDLMLMMRPKKDHLVLQTQHKVSEAIRDRNTYVDLLNYQIRRTAGYLHLPVFDVRRFLGDNPKSYLQDYIHQNATTSLLLARQIVHEKWNTTVDCPDNAVILELMYDLETSDRNAPRVTNAFEFNATVLASIERNMKQNSSSLAKYSASLLANMHFDAEQTSVEVSRMRARVNENERLIGIFQGKVNDQMPKLTAMMAELAARNKTNASLVVSAPSYNNDDDAVGRNSTASANCNRIEVLDWYQHSSPLSHRQIVGWEVFRVVWEAHTREFADPKDQFNIYSAWEPLSGLTKCRLRLKRAEPSGAIRISAFLIGFRGNVSITMAIHRFGRGDPRQLTDQHYWEKDKGRGWDKFLTNQEFQEDGYLSADHKVYIVATVCLLTNNTALD